MFGRYKNIVCFGHIPDQFRDLWRLLVEKSFKRHTQKTERAVAGFPLCWLQRTERRLFSHSYLALFNIKPSNKQHAVLCVCMCVCVFSEE